MTAQSETQSVSIISYDFPNIQDNKKIFKKASPGKINKRLYQYHEHWLI